MKKEYLVLFALCALVAFFQTGNAFAANLSSLPMPIKSYPVSASNNTAVYQTTYGTAYGTIWASDLSTIHSASAGGSYPIRVEYPLDRGGSKTGYTGVSAFFSSQEVNEDSIIRSATVYRRASGSESIGSVSSADTRIWRIGGNGGARSEIVYKVDNTNYYKKGHVDSTVLKSRNISSVQPTTTSWQFPMTNAVCSWSSSTNMSWGNYNYSSSRPTRSYHTGLDIKSGSGDGNVYAAATGVVRATGYNSDNGYYVVIEHAIGNKTVYSFYAHLSNISVSKGNVSKGQKIGVWGKTGTATGYHVHFSIASSYKEGSYAGYAPKFSGDQTIYNGVTFYNPGYVIRNGRLP